MNQPSQSRWAFKHKHAVLPVIHVVSRDQALKNARVASKAGADGVFLINHGTAYQDLLEAYDAVRKEFPQWWIGLNCLDLDAEQVFAVIPQTVSGIWTDNAGINEAAEEQVYADKVRESIRSSGWNGLYFGGVAFKYQRHVKNLKDAAAIAARYMDVVTTSGPGTGEAADLEKITAMKSALGDTPLAIASGITPGNVADYLPHADCFLVATGISSSFVMLDENLVKELVGNVRAHDPRRRADID